MANKLSKKKLPGIRQNIRFVKKEQRAIENAVRITNKSANENGGAELTFNKAVGSAAYQWAKSVIKA